MQFFAANGERPVRLREATRAFAFASLNHVYGKDTRKTPGVALDDWEDFETSSDLEKQDVAIQRICQRAPIRICEGERISGAATLGMAIDHKIPATYRGEDVMRSISHLTIDYEVVLKQGVGAIYAQVEEALGKYAGTEKEPFLRSCLHCLDSMKLWHSRYLDALREMPDYRANYENLQKVPFAPAESFYEAVQSLWFTFAFVRLCGNWPGIGRLDWLLGDYLEKDLANHVLTLDEARDILAHFFIKGCEWICGGVYGNGDAQHYQNIVLAGVDENGNEVTNAVTYLVLDILEELGISDFTTTVRLNARTDPKLLHRVAQVIKLGGGILAVYNEDLVIRSLTDFGYPLKDARKFANGGCWEIQIPGKTFFGYIPFDGLQILQQETLGGQEKRADYPDFSSLYAQFIADLKRNVEAILVRMNKRFVNQEAPVEAWKWTPSMPCTIVSLFELGCVEKGCSYYEGGPDYNMISPHFGGLPDVVNSLYAMKKLVFDEKKVTLAQLLDILEQNWENHEPLRRYVQNRYTYYGNDHDEVDEIAQRLVKDFADICDACDKQTLLRFPAGISTFGRQLAWADQRMATAYGKKAHEILAGNFSPTPGTDKEGATAIIRSYCKTDLKRVVCGAALDLKLLPAAVNGCNGEETLVSLLRGFVALGGQFMQLDIADAALLKQAQEHPEDYQNLSVRVSGWNARFVTLNKHWQDMIIAQMGSEAL